MYDISGCFTVSLKIVICYFEQVSNCRIRVAVITISIQQSVNDPFSRFFRNISVMKNSGFEIWAKVQWAWALFGFIWSETTKSKILWYFETARRSPIKSFNNSSSLRMTFFLEFQSNTENMFSVPISVRQYEVRECSVWRTQMFGMKNTNVLHDKLSRSLWRT